jgi:hypothetical protein
MRQDYSNVRSPKAPQRAPNAIDRPTQGKRKDGRRSEKQWHVVSGLSEEALLEEPILRIFESRFGDLLDLIRDGG